MPAPHGRGCQTCCSRGMRMLLWHKAAASMLWEARPARPSTGRPCSYYMQLEAAGQAHSIYSTISLVFSLDPLTVNGRGHVVGARHSRGCIPVSTRWRSHGFSDPLAARSSSCTCFTYVAATAVALSSWANGACSPACNMSPMVPAVACLRRTVEVFDAQRGSWQDLGAQLISERKYCAAASLGGRLLVLGGMKEARRR